MSGLRRFPWQELAAAVAEALAAWTGPSPRAAENRRRFVAEDGERRFELRVPLVLPQPAADEELSHWAERAAVEPGRQVLILMQAGACALGFFEGGEALAHRTLRRYVVRGKGRAQPAYLKTKGKSRYGSRLRLRNARRLLDEAAATLREWRDEHGGFDRVFHACAPRSWAEFLREDLPFDADGPLTKVPLDLNRPSHDEMSRAWRALSHGSWLISS